MNEYPRAAEWLYATLTTPAIAGLTGGVHEHPAPQGTAYPAITFSLQAATDVGELAEHRIWAELLLLVRAWGQTRSTASLRAIADEIDARLHRGSGTTSDGRVISSVRLEAHHDRNVADGIEYRALGGIYQLLVQPLSP